MKQSLLLIFGAFLVFASCASSDKTEMEPENPEPVNKIDSIPTSNKMKIKIGTSTFLATLNNNKTAAAFKSLLPMTLSMNELNGNEKYVDLPSNLPTNASNPGSIQVGDIMLYGSSTLVLFYKSFSTSYSYTRLGSIDDVTDLVAALGPGNVTIIYE